MVAHTLLATAPEARLRLWLYRQRPLARTGRRVMARSLALLGVAAFCLLCWYGVVAGVIALGRTL